MQHFYIHFEWDFTTFEILVPKSQIYGSVGTNSKNDRIPNTEINEYRIVFGFKNQRIPNTNSTIRCQLFEYRIIRTIRSNSGVYPLFPTT